jgi:GNAT superfamily N-acetyltransferase
MPIELRTAQPDDVPLLQQLIAASVRGLSTGFYTTQQIESALVHMFGVDTQLIADGTYFVMEDQTNGEFAACGGWSKRRTLYGGDQHKSGEDNLLDPAHDAARIRAFFVHPSYARRGLGKQLLQACEDAAQQSGFTRFEMGATLPGVPLYQVCGYEPMKELAVTMPDGETLPILQMGKSLK